MLKAKGASHAVANGTEARQRREKELFDHEQLELMESILSCSVAEHQRAAGTAPRKALDTLTLGVIVTLHFALGQRCMNVRVHRPQPTRVVLFPCAHSLASSSAPQLDDLKWGYLEITRFTKHQLWDRILPSYLRVSSSGKMDEVGERKHLAGIFNHRDPMRGALPMTGLYFAYQFFTLQDVRQRM